MRRDKLNEELQDLQRGAKTQPLRKKHGEAAKDDEQKHFFYRKMNGPLWFPIHFPLALSIEPLFFCSLSHLRDAKKPVITAVFPLFSYCLEVAGFGEQTL